jgi:sugar/nucleoside kinase (ribokinase family)
VDTGWDPADRWDAAVWELLAQADFFLPNESEAQRLSGQDTVEGALEWLAGRIPLVVIKLGAEGAIARRGDEVVRVSSLPVRVVDTTGAGDSFDAGFVFAYLRGLSLRECLRYGVICGALSTRSAGGTTSQATLAEVQAALPGLQGGRSE